MDAKIFFAEKKMDKVISSNHETVIQKEVKAGKSSFLTKKEVGLSKSRKQKD